MVLKVLLLLSVVELRTGLHENHIFRRQRSAVLYVEEESTHSDYIYFFMGKRKKNSRFARYIPACYQNHSKLTLTPSAQLKRIKLSTSRVIVFFVIILPSLENRNAFDSALPGQSGSAHAVDGVFGALDCVQVTEPSVCTASRCNVSEVSLAKFLSDTY